MRTADSFVLSQAGRNGGRHAAVAFMEGGDGCGLGGGSGRRFSGGVASHPVGRRTGWDQSVPRPEREAPRSPFCRATQRADAGSEAHERREIGCQLGVRAAALPRPNTCARTHGSSSGLEVATAIAAPGSDLDSARLRPAVRGVLVLSAPAATAHTREDAATLFMGALLMVLAREMRTTTAGPLRDRPGRAPRRSTIRLSWGAVLHPRTSRAGLATRAAIRPRLAPRERVKGAAAFDPNPTSHPLCGPAACTPWHHARRTLEVP
jgi:hypothetical protein